MKLSLVPELGLCEIAMQSNNIQVFQIMSPFDSSEPLHLPSVHPRSLRSAASARVKKVDKAGLILHGMATHDPVTGEPLAKPAHYVVAPWSEGRFSDDGKKLYFLASGSVDEGELLLAGAKREAFEETGIDIDAIATGKISGVSTTAHLARPYERDLVDLRDRPLRTRIYPIELHGIQHLAKAKTLDGMPVLKNAEAQVQGQFLPHVREESRIKNRTPSLPTFDELICWMRSGIIPDAPWNTDHARHDTDLGAAKHFHVLELDTMQVLIEERARNIDDGETVLPGGRQPGDKRPVILNPVEFGIWRDRLPTKDKQWIDARSSKIKEALKRHGVLGDDHATIKLVTNDRLEICQEGTDVLTVPEYITRIYEGASTSKYYDRSMMNVQESGYFAHGVNHHATNAIAQKQISLLAPILTREDIEEARIPKHAKMALQTLRAHYVQSSIVSR